MTDLTNPAPPADELRPCPFCGATDGRLIAAFTRATDEFAYWSVECLDCACEIASDASQAEADAAWNTRAPDPALSVLTVENERREAFVTEAARAALLHVEHARTDVVNPVNGSAPYSFVLFHGQRIEFHDNPCANSFERDAGSGKAAAYAQKINDALFELAKAAARNALSSLTVENERLRAAVNLAANRLARLAVDYIASGDPKAWEIGQWEDEARAALSSLPAMKGEG